MSDDESNAMAAVKVFCAPVAHTETTRDNPGRVTVSSGPGSEGGVELSQRAQTSSLGLCVGVGVGVGVGV